MSQRKFSEDKELLAIIERLEAMKAEGRTLYLDPEQYEDIVEYYILEKKKDRAHEVIASGLKIHPGNSRLIVLQIALYLEEAKVQEARDLVNEILHDNSLHVQLMHAEVLVVENRLDEARGIIDSFLDKENDDIDCLDIGFLCIDMGFFDKAEFWLRKSLALNPDNDDAAAGICECYQEMGRYEETIDIYNTLIDKDPYSSDYWLGLAKSYFYLGQADKAIEACDFAIVADEKIGEVHTIRAHAFYQLENYEESIEAYKESWRLGNLEAEFATAFIALCYINMDDWDNAYEYYKQTIARTEEDSPMYPELLINSARCLFKMNRIEEAHHTLEFAQHRFPQNITAFIHDAQYYLEEGNREMAVEQFNKAIDINPDAETWNLIATIALNCSEFELAQKAFETIEKYDPDHEILTDNLPYALFKINFLNDEEKDEERHKKNTPIVRKIIKEQLRKIADKTGKRPEKYDIDSYIRQAEENGADPKEIREMRSSLEELNDLVENYDIDQEEDEADSEKLN